MADLPEIVQWEDGVYQLETTDPVEGGADGIDNQQAKQLANRTAYLKQVFEQATAQATETEKGTAEIATQAEVDTGTDDSRFVTSKKLKAWVKQATETVMGMMKVATQAQTDAGTDDTVAVTPKKLRWGFSVLLAQNGYIAFPAWMGGVILQWASGQNQTTGSITWNFPLVFPSNVVFANGVIGATSASDYADRSATLTVLTNSKAEFILTQNGAPDTRGAGSNWKLFAIGY